MISAINSFNSINQTSFTGRKVVSKGAKKAQQAIGEIIENETKKAKSNPKLANIITNIKNGWNKVKDFSKNVWNKTKEFAKKSWEWVKEKFEKVKEFFAERKEAKAPTKTEAK